MNWISLFFALDCNLLRWEAPPDWILNILVSFAFLVFPIKFESRISHVDSTKVMFVCNHNISALEMIATFASIYVHFGLVPRGLADKWHFRIPVWSSFLHWIGAFNGNKENAELVMNCGSCVLVFPGGGNEVLRPANVPKYSLLWKERKGFARLAAKYGYTIVPVGVVGLDDMFTILFRFKFDAKILGDDRIFDIPVLFPTSWQRLYGIAGSAISTQNFIWDNENDCAKLRDLTRDAVLSNIKDALELQKKDKNRFVLARKCQIQ